MVFLLCALLAIALAITIAGVLLSPGVRVSNQRGVYAIRGAGMRTRRVHPYYDTDAYAYGRVRRRRSQFQIEQRAWTSIVASLNVFRLLKPYSTEQTPWLGILLVLLCVFVCGIYTLGTLLPNSALSLAGSWNAVTQNATNATPTSYTPSQLLSGISGASRALTRISQVDPAQYASMDEYNAWWPSACSAAAMTAVINAYGHHYRLTDILKVETGVGEITPAEGLLEPVGIDRTVAQFGFQTTWLKNPSLDDVITIANHGRPIIVNFPPNRWAGGHLLVVIGGNNDYVFLADSSRLNMQAMARNTFMKYWVGFAVVATPQ